MKKHLLILSFLFLFFVSFAGKFVLIPITETNHFETLFNHSDLKIHYYDNDCVLATTDNLSFEKIVVLDENAFADVDYYVIVYCVENQKENYLERIAGSVEVLYSGGNFFIMKIVSDGFMPAKNDGIVKIRNTEVCLPKTRFDYSVITEPDVNVLQCISQVGTANTMGYIQHLENYVTRRCNHANSIAAQNWIKERYESFGLDTTYVQPVTGINPWWGGGPVQSGNVIAIQYGTEFPYEFIVCGGHYDSFAWGGSEPGADDDASGTAGVLEAARILSQYDFKRSIIYCAFTAEECGIDGSDQFAKQCSIQSKNILGYFNLDMIGYLTQGNEIKIHLLYPNSAATLADYFYNVCDIYFPSIPKQKYPNHTLNAQSDHYSFNYYGYKGIWWFENPNDESPHIHTSDDKVGPSVNNPEQVTVFTQALVASIATLAIFDNEAPQPYSPPTHCNAEVVEGMCIKITWNAPEAETPNEYRVYRDGVKIALTDKLFYMDTVTDYGDYCYTVKAIYEEGESGFSNKSCVEIIPVTHDFDPPTDCLAEIVEDMSIKITWKAPEEGTPDEYLVYRNNSKIFQTTELVYRDTVTDFGEYCYKIKALYDTKESEFSNTSCVSIINSITEFHNKIKIYPNPTTGTLTISNIKDATVSFYSPFGSHLKTFEHVFNNEIINVANLSNGIYFLKIIEDNNVKYEKIILSK